MAEEKDAKPHGATNGQTAPSAEQNGGSGATNGQTNGQPPKPKKTDTGSSKKKGPAGGFDNTPLPRAPPGYTVKFTFHRANNLPLADINTLSADPFIVAQLTTSLPTRHKEDPPLMRRTQTIRQNTDPVWECDWIVANVPASGFRLKCRIYDEDPADHDDRLGNVHIDVGSISENWAGIHNQTYDIKKRMVSKRAFALRALAVCFGKRKHMNGTLNVSVEVLGKTQDENGGRAYTIGPQFWIRHYSPLLGRLTGQKDPGDEEEKTKANGKPKAQKYNFQSNEMQLRGPVPEHMYHRYVEFKPFVKGMFTAKGIRGFLLSKALHHQHARVYNFDGSTDFEVMKEPSKEFAEQFLELVHHDKGGRIFTYVITLDGLFRFTETGKEFGIDMLSKHSMHSDVAAYIAFSGEFFVRRLKHPDRAPPEDGGNNESHPPNDIGGGPPEEEPRITDPSYYELIIDNDSGTYRPNAKLLPQLKEFLEANFPGLHVSTLDCQDDAEKMGHMKDEQRERKKTEGDQVVYMQADRSGSVSSSDEEGLDNLASGGGMPKNHLRHQLQREAGAKVDAKKANFKDYKSGLQSRENKTQSDSPNLDNNGPSTTTGEGSGPNQPTRT